MESFQADSTLMQLIKRYSVTEPELFKKNVALKRLSKPISADYRAMEPRLELPS